MVCSETLPCVSSKIRRPQQYKHISNCVLQLHNLFSCADEVNVYNFLRAIFIYVWILHHQDQLRKYHAIFWHVRDPISRLPTCFSLRFGASNICLQHISGDTMSGNVRHWSCLLSCQSPPRPRFSIWWFLTQKRKPCETCPCIRQFSISINFPRSSICFSNITSEIVSVVLVTSMYFSGEMNDPSVGRYNLTWCSTTWWR